jgi:hypothetical protein
VKKFSFNLILLLLLALLPVSGQNDTTGIIKEKAALTKNSLALFGNDEILNLSIRCDLTKFLKKNLNGTSLDAILTFYSGNSDSMNMDIKVKNRGQFRFETCDFPPMEVIFKKPVHAYPDSLHIKKIKLVTHCESGNVNDEYVLREYLVYKLYNIVTDTSYRVRLLRVSYIDTYKKRKPITQYGFFIEPADILAKRINSVVLKTKTLTQKHIFPDVMDKVSIFNYMISNWDWTVPRLHNITVMKSLNLKSSEFGIAIPYDFDLSGVVNAYYAVTPPEYSLKNIRDRIFLGVCRERNVFEQDLQYFHNRKEEMYSIIGNNPYLNPRAKKDITDFLDQFFDETENKKSLDFLVDYLLNVCKTIQ